MDVSEPFGNYVIVRRSPEPTNSRKSKQGGTRALMMAFATTANPNNECVYHAGEHCKPTPSFEELLALRRML